MPKLINHITVISFILLLLFFAKGCNVLLQEVENNKHVEKEKVLSFTEHLMGTYYPDFSFKNYLSKSLKNDICRIKNENDDRNFKQRQNYYSLLGSFHLELLKDTSEAIIYFYLAKQYLEEDKFLDSLGIFNQIDTLLSNSKCFLSSPIDSVYIKEVLLSFDTSCVYSSDLIVLYDLVGMPNPVNDTTEYDKLNEKENAKNFSKEKATVYKKNISAEKKQEPLFDNNSEIVFDSPIDKVRKLEKELDYLKKNKAFYDNIHKHRIENRFYRALSYTQINQNDFNIEFLREGEFKQHLKVHLEFELNVSDVNSYNDNLCSELTRCIIKTLNDYYRVAKGEREVKNSMDKLLSSVEVNINYPDQVLQRDIHYNSEFGQHLKIDYGKKNNKKVISINKNDKLGIKDLAFLIGYNTFYILDNSTVLVEKKSYISTNLNTQGDFKLDLTFLFYNMFSEEYRTFSYELPIINKEILIIEDSIRLLKD